MNGLFASCVAVTVLNNMPEVALVRSEGHRQGVKDALALIEDDVAAQLKGKKKILIKPNFVSTSILLAATHVDAVKAVLELVRQHFSGKIFVGESPPFSKLSKGLSRFGYYSLQDEYDVEFADLSSDGYFEVQGCDRSLKPMKLRVSKVALDCDYRISVTRPKTHDFVIVTLSVKNMAVGCIFGDDKPKIHRGMQSINLNIAKVYEALPANLGVIDGFEGMDGDGPSSGNPVDLKAAGASLNPVSLDAVFSKVMGFEPLDIGYLYYLNEQEVGVAELSRIKVIGEPIEALSMQFKPHHSFKKQQTWRQGNKHGNVPSLALSVVRLTSRITRKV
jgi:uncharacterized protein (DUF362 family)